MSSRGDQCFSGGVDGTIQSWNTPNPNVDPYDSYGTSWSHLYACSGDSVGADHGLVAESSVLRGALCGHTDSVWGLVYSSAYHRLLSCSADGTVRLWSAADVSPSLVVFNEDGGEGTSGSRATSGQNLLQVHHRSSVRFRTRSVVDQLLSLGSWLWWTHFGPNLQTGFCGSVAELGVPTSVDLVRCEPTHMVTSFSSGHIGLFNMETQQLLLKLDSAGPPGTTRHSATQIFCSDLQVF